VNVWANKGIVVWVDWMIDQWNELFCGGMGEWMNDELKDFLVGGLKNEIYFKDGWMHTWISEWANKPVTNNSFITVQVINSWND
jgi:hypothetical protein